MAEREGVPTAAIEAARVFSSPMPALTLIADAVPGLEDEERLGGVAGTLVMAMAGLVALVAIPFSVLIVLAWISAG